MVYCSTYAYCLLKETNPTIQTPASTNPSLDYYDAIIGLHQSIQSCTTTIPSNRLVYLVESNYLTKSSRRYTRWVYFDFESKLLPQLINNGSRYHAMYCNGVHNFIYLLIYINGLFYMHTPNSLVLDYTDILIAKNIFSEKNTYSVNLLMLFAVYTFV